MRYFIAINLIICAGIGYVLRNANPGESCNAEGIELLRNTFPHFAIAYTLLMLLAFRRKSTILMLLAGVSLWRPLLWLWHGAASAGMKSTITSCFLWRFS